MRWRLVFSKRSDRQLGKMDPGVRRIVITWLLRHIDGCENPRALGKALSADRSGQWRYRIGDYRVLCEIRDDEVVVLVIDVGHRSKVYRAH